MSLMSSHRRHIVGSRRAAVAGHHGSGGPPVQQQPANASGASLRALGSYSRRNGIRVSSKRISPHKMCNVHGISLHAPSTAHLPTALEKHGYPTSTRLARENMQPRSIEACKASTAPPQRSTRMPRSMHAWGVLNNAPAVRTLQHGGFMQRIIPPTASCHSHLDCTKGLCAIPDTRSLAC